MSRSRREGRKELWRARLLAVGTACLRVPGPEGACIRHFVDVQAAQCGQASALPNACWVLNISGL